MIPFELYRHPNKHCPHTILLQLFISLKLTTQAVQSVTRPDTVGYKWHQVVSTVTKLAADATVSVV